MEIHFALKQRCGSVGTRASRRLAWFPSLRPEVSGAALWSEVVHYFFFTPNPLGSSFAEESTKVVVVGTMF